MRYGILFDCELRHDYHSNLGEVVHEALSDAQREAVLRQYRADVLFRVSPSERTLPVMAGHSLLVKTMPYGFRVGVRLDPGAGDARPLVPLGADFEISFRLGILDSAFFNYT